MAFGKNTNSLYFSVRNGKVTRYSKTQQEGTTVVPTKDGQPRHYFIYDFIEGLITGFRTKEDEIMGQRKLFFQIQMTDDGENYTVELDSDSNYFQSFAMTILNADINQPVRIAPFMKEEDGKKKSGLFVIQNGKPLKYKFTKDNPGDLPSIEVTKNKQGKVVDVDREERNKFLFAELNNWLSAGITVNRSNNLTPVSSEAVKSESDTLEIFITDEDDDLPF
jgi:hypothetical protein